MSACKAIGVLVLFAVAIAWSLPATAQEHVEGPVLISPDADHGATGHGEAAGAETPSPLVFDPDLAIFSAIVFLLLLVILGKFAWPTISAALDERERKIADNIASAAAKHEQARQLLAEHESRLAETAGEVRELLEEARRDAEATKSRIVAEARQAADQERNRAVREIEVARDSAMQELAVTSANLAIELTRKVVQQELTPQRQAQIVRDALGKLAATKPSKN